MLKLVFRFAWQKTGIGMGLRVNQYVCPNIAVVDRCRNGLH